MEGRFWCVHTIRFSEPTKIGSLKTDRVNGPIEGQVSFSTLFGILRVCINSSFLGFLDGLERSMF